MNLDKFNENQQKAIQHTEGSCCVLASAGSGKTAVMINRIAYMIEQGIAPENILAISFTKKASEELKERLSKLIGDDSELVNVGTFHSICYSVLRAENKKVAASTIAKDWWQKKVVKEIMLPSSTKFPKSINLDWQPRQALSFIGFQKNSLIRPDDDLIISESIEFLENKLRKLYTQYEMVKESENVIDFDDMLIMCYELFRDNPAVLEKYRSKYKYIMVDEYQDTNIAQNEIIKQLGKKHKNVFAVGDDFQCLTSDTMITTQSGDKKIKDITKDDIVVSASGHGEHQLAKIEDISKKYHCGNIVKITTKTGNVIKTTPEHMLFMLDEPNNTNKKHYVYLMYKQNVGYRIGQTSSIRQGKMGDRCGYKTRANGERADKVWVLESVDDVGSATYYEAYYSFKYGIPQTIFCVEYENSKMTQEYVDELYDSIDTVKRAERLLKDKGLNKDFPHFYPKSRYTEDNQRINLNFNMFGSSRITHGKPHKRATSEFTSYNHELSYCTICEEFNELGNRYITSCKKHMSNSSNYYYNGRKTSGEYDLCYDIIKNIQAESKDKNFYLNLSLNAKITTKIYNLMPACNILHGMYVPVYTPDGIVDDIVEDVEIIQYDDYVYDINVKHYRNYIANNIIVHNCIYGFRGSNVQLILNFQKDWEDSQVIELGTNYRSTTNIVEWSNKLIANNINQYDKTSVANRPSSQDPVLFNAVDEDDEARVIGEEIATLLQDSYTPNDFAILYRTNAQSRALEETMIKNKIPYIVLGSANFYDRKEIKDILAYMRLSQDLNLDDELERIINKPNRFLGKVFISGLQNYSFSHNTSMYEALIKYPEVKSWKYSQGTSFLHRFLGHLSESNEMKPADMIRLIRKETGYDEWIIDSDDGEEENERIENLNSMTIAASKYSSVEEFLDYVDNISKTQSKDKSEVNKVKLMSIHRSKGLEFPVVFLSGVSENILPHARSTTQDEVEEERRLCYVGMTRSKDLLYMSWTNFYQNKEAGASIFIEELVGDTNEYLKNGIDMKEVIKFEKSCINQYNV